MLSLAVIKKKPEFTVEYGNGHDIRDDSDMECEGTHIEVYPLLEDYVNGDLRLL